MLGERKLLKKIVSGIMLAFLTLSSFQVAWSSALTLLLGTSKSTYNVGEVVFINGNLTLNNNTVLDGLTAIQVNDPQGNLFVMRTMLTGINNTKSWPVEILSIFTVDSSGNPQYNFEPGDNAGFQVTIRNNELLSYAVIVTLNIYYSDGVPFSAWTIYNGTIEANKTVTVISWPLPIPGNAPVGPAVAYISVLDSLLPKNGGFAFSPEKKALFTIGSTTYEKNPASTSYLESAEGSFNLTFKTPCSNAKLGNYTIYATSFYPVGVYPYFTTNSLTFEVILRGDLNGDGKVDMRDVGLVARHFGETVPPAPANCDVVYDGKIDMKDVGTVARDYGKSGVYCGSSLKETVVRDSSMMKKSDFRVSDLPWLEVSPAFTVIGPERSIDKEFTISINVNNLNAVLHMVGFKFELVFNSTLIKAVKIEEGSFLQDFQCNKHGAFFSASLQENMTQSKISVLGMLLPNASGQWVCFPEGNGTLACIKFAILNQSNVECYMTDFVLANIGLVDDITNQISTNAPRNGTLKILPFTTTGTMIDLYGGAMNEGYGSALFLPPYGGQGSNNPMDLVVPQAEVYFYAKVTNDSQPVPNKTVCFNVEKPDGSVLLNTTVVTDSNGIALINFGMPWPREDPESLFGEWTVTATISISDVRINDTLTFHYDYLVRWMKVTTDKFEYNHGECVEITIEYGTYAQQYYPLLLSVVLMDELSVPVGITLLETEVGGAEYCTYTNFTATLSIHIIKWAFAGIATIHVNAFDKDPTEGGIFWSPEYTPAPEIVIQPY